MKFWKGRKNVKKAQRTDLLREMKKSFNRYISILLIMALGVAFYAGVRSAEPDMQLSAKEFYDSTNYMDIRVLGTLGMTEGDVVAIRAVEGIAQAEGGYQTELFWNTQDRDYQMSVYSLGESINQVYVEGGRLPEQQDECFVDADFMDNHGYAIGDVITLKVEEGTELSDVLHTDTFRIVGFGSFPGYLSWQRGAVSIGTGVEDGFVFLPKEAFSMEVFTVVYATVEGAMEYNPYSEEYEDYIAEVVQRVEAIADARCEIRFDEVTGPYWEDVYEAEIADGGQVLADVKAELADIEMAEWYVLDRNTVQQFVEYGMNSERIGNLGKVFPAVFYLVAALVSLTTMTRMIEEERTQIGTMKALGYGKKAIVSKYMWYSLSATLLGGVFGVIIGSYLFPWVIIMAYGILYSNLPYVVLPVQWGLALTSVLIAVICTVAATLSSCYKELVAAPAVLMRPSAPAAGKRVFLEYVKPVWKHLSFSWKATCRNLFRYKKRFFMTIFGIGGCMALLLVGFGLRDSIMEIVNNQYKNIWTYDAYLSVNDTDIAFEELAAGDLMENQLYAQVKTLDVETEASVKSASLFVPERLSDLEEFLKLRDRVSQEKYTLTEEGVILSEKLAKTLEVSVGDEVILSVDDVTKRSVTVMAIAENYMANYIYMSVPQYEKTFEEEADFNQLYLQLPVMTVEQEEEFSRKLLEIEAVETVTYVHELQENVATMMQSLELVVVVLIVAAGMLAFIVLYNLNNINIIERRRELATLKVLGFYDMEVGNYVYRENVLLTVIGILAGVVMGIFLHRFVILTVEVDMIMFGRNIEPLSYLYSVFLTCVFAVLINFGMFYKLRKIDMVESLKSAE